MRRMGTRPARAQLKGGFPKPRRVLGHRQGLLVPQPLFVAVLAPFGQILLANGLAAKFSRQHGLHFRKGIEPGDQRPRFLTILQPAVDLFLDGPGEASDFTFGSFIHNFYGRI